MPVVPSSLQAGFLRSVTPIAMDAALEDAINPTIAGITGLDGDKYVRPRLTASPATIPDVSVNWVAFGVSRIMSDTCAATIQASDDVAKVIRNQVVELVLSWYGPGAGHLCEVFRDGLQISQNRDLLRASDFGFVDVSEARKVPEIVKQQFVARYDQTLTLNRRTERLFNVFTLRGFGIDLRTDPQGSTPITISY